MLLVLRLGRRRILRVEVRRQDGLPHLQLPLDGARVCFEFRLEHRLHGRGLAAVIGCFQVAFVRGELGEAVDDGPEGRGHA